MFQQLRVTRQNTVSLVAAIEDCHYRLFRELSLRFLPYDEGISLLLEMLASETDALIDELDLQSTHAGTQAEADGCAVPECLNRDASGHFFIVDETEALAVLDALLDLCDQAIEFYRLLQLGAAGSTAPRGAYHCLASYRATHRRILLEARSGLVTRTPVVATKPRAAALIASPV